MHTENFTAIASAAADAPGLEQPDGEQLEIAALAGFDDAWGDPPPHAANPSPRATTAAIIAADRRRRRPLLNAGDDCCSTLGRRRIMPTQYTSIIDLLSTDLFGCSQPPGRCVGHRVVRYRCPIRAATRTPQAPNASASTKAGLLL
jgi:hypothetical protein